MLVPVCDAAHETTFHKRETRRWPGGGGAKFRSRTRRERIQALPPRGWIAAQLFGGGRELAPPAAGRARRARRAAQPRRGRRDAVEAAHRESRTREQHEPAQDRLADRRHATRQHERERAEVRADDLERLDDLLARSRASGVRTSAPSPRGRRSHRHNVPRPARQAARPGRAPRAWRVSRSRSRRCRSRRGCAPPTRVALRTRSAVHPCARPLRRMQHHRRRVGRRHAPGGAVGAARPDRPAATPGGARCPAACARSCGRVRPGGRRSVIGISPTSCSASRSRDSSSSRLSARRTSSQPTPWRPPLRFDASTCERRPRRARRDRRPRLSERSVGRSPSSPGRAVLRSLDFPTAAA